MGLTCSFVVNLSYVVITHFFDIIFEKWTFFVKFLDIIVDILGDIFCPTFKSHCCNLVLILVIILYFVLGLDSAILPVFGLISVRSVQKRV